MSEMSEVLKLKDCYLKNNPKNQLGYCALEPKAQYVSVVEKREKTLENQGGRSAQVWKVYTFYEIMSPGGAHWTKSKEQASDYWLVYDMKRFACWPVEKELFKNAYVVGSVGDKKSHTANKEHHHASKKKVTKKGTKK